MIRENIVLRNPKGIVIHHAMMMMTRNAFLGTKLTQTLGGNFEKLLAIFSSTRISG